MKDYFSTLNTNNLTKDSFLNTLKRTTLNLNDLKKTTSLYDLTAGNFYYSKKFPDIINI